MGYKNTFQQSMKKLNWCVINVIKSTLMLPNLKGTKNQCMKVPGSIWDACSFQAAYKSDIGTHMKIVHEGIRKKCDECDYQSKHTRELRNHMKKQHKKNVSFKKGVFNSSELTTAVESNPPLNTNDTDISTN